MMIKNTKNKNKLLIRSSLKRNRRKKNWSKVLFSLIFSQINSNRITYNKHINPFASMMPKIKSISYRMCARTFPQIHCLFASTCFVIRSLEKAAQENLLTVCLLLFWFFFFFSFLYTHRKCVQFKWNFNNVPVHVTKSSAIRLNFYFLLSYLSLLSRFNELHTFAQRKHVAYIKHSTFARFIAQKCNRQFKQFQFESGYTSILK